MPSSGKYVVRGLFLFILVCFFFPFVTVSCDNQTVKTFNGTELAIGTNIQDPVTGESKRTEPQTYALVALGAAVLGFLVSFMKKKGAMVVAGIAGAVGALMILLQKGRLDEEIARQQLQADYKVGFYLLIVSFLATVLYAVMALRSKTVSAPIQVQTPVYNPAAPSGTPRFCGKCGTRLEAGNSFCGQCGEKLV